MELAEFQSLQAKVLWAAFALSAAFGALAHRTHFCTMGAIGDVFSMGDWGRLRMWALALGVGMAGFHGMGWLGWIDPAQAVYANGRVVWLSALLGGGLFGFGMVLASGCGSKTLIRIGGGSLKSLVVFCVMGLAAFATLRGVTAVLRVNTVDRVAFDMPGGSALPLWLAQRVGVAPAQAGLVLGLALGGALAWWALKDRGFRSSRPQWLGGAGVGLLLVGMWWVSGHLGFVAEHPQTLESVYVATQSGRMEALTFTAPMAYTLDWLVYFSDATKRLTLGVVSVAGVVVGAFLSAWTRGSFRWEGFRDTQDTALHLAGAACMGVGGVTAMGCTIGQGLSGLSTLSLTSAFAVLGIVLGALCGFRFQVWLLERE